MLHSPAMLEEGRDAQGYHKRAAGRVGAHAGVPR
jgi:hypothetical protein